jgi:ankyrin repeat protein
VDRRNALGRTPLYRACHNGHEGVVRLLLGAGASPLIPDHDGCLPAFHACSEEMQKMFADAADSSMMHMKNESLAGGLALPRACSILSESRRLLAACKEYNQEAAESILLARSVQGSVGVDLLECLDDDGRTPLICASGSRFDAGIGVVKLLIEKKAGIDAVDAIGNTPLMAAAWGESIGTCKCLLAAGAVSFAENKDGRTALDMAATDKIRALVVRATASQLGLSGSALEVMKEGMKGVVEHRISIESGTSWEPSGARELGREEWVEMNELELVMEEMTLQNPREMMVQAGGIVGDGDTIQGRLAQLKEAADRASGAT